MEIIPAIDIRGGKCVRLYQGDYDMETVFSDDPVGMAMNWQSLERCVCTLSTSMGRLP